MQCGTPGNSFVDSFFQLCLSTSSLYVRSETHHEDVLKNEKKSYRSGIQYARVLSRVCRDSRVCSRVRSGGLGGSPRPRAPATQPQPHTLIQYDLRIFSPLPPEPTERCLSSKKRRASPSRLSQRSKYRLARARCVGFWLACSSRVRNHARRSRSAHVVAVTQHHLIFSPNHLIFDFSIRLRLRGERRLGSSSDTPSQSSSWYSPPAYLRAGCICCSFCPLGTSCSRCPRGSAQRRWPGSSS